MSTVGRNRCTGILTYEDAGSHGAGVDMISVEVPACIRHHTQSLGFRYCKYYLENVVWKKNLKIKNKILKIIMTVYKYRKIRSFCNIIAISNM